MSEISGNEPPKAGNPLGGSSLDQLKSVTQNLKSVTAAIPQQAILHKTGIIADPGLTEAQKAAAKARTSRISLADAMGAAPVKNEANPMKTIRIKRPTDIPGATATLKRPTVAPPPPATPSAAEAPAAAPAAEAPAAPVDSTTVTQRKTLKISRPGSVVRPAGKFGIKKPASTTAETVVKSPAAPAGEAPAEVADIADIPEMPAVAPLAPAAPAGDVEKAVPNGIAAVSVAVQLAACAAMGFLAWKLYEASVTATF